MSEKLKTKLIIYLFSFLGLFCLIFTFEFLWNDFSEFVKEKLYINLSKLKKKEFVLGLDLKGGISLLYEADLKDLPKTRWQDAIEGVRDVIERRVNFFGFTESSVGIIKSGEHYRVIVEIPGKIDLDEAKKLVGETPVLEFREKKDDKFVTTSLTGRMLKRAQVVFNPTTGFPEVEVEFNQEGTKIFKDLTKKNLGKELAIYLDGIPISIPVVREVITDGRAVISGNFTIDEAKKLAMRLNAGALPVPINLLSSEKIGSILGKIDFEKTLKAGIIGFFVLLLYLIIYYRLLGIIASFSLILYGIFILFIFKNLPVTLTLSGIAGFVISLGMAVDANILIFERMKEELKEGKDFYMAGLEGTKRAWPAIRDANFTTLLIMIVLYQVGTGFVKGFSFTLSLGIITSLITNFLLTKHLILAISETRFSNILNFNILFKKTK